jgi:uncharacterized membrane protein HdeD (DUF308 family)
MLGVMSRYWWTYALRGLIAILFGIGAILWPDLTISALVILFGAYVVVDGVLAIFNGVTGRGIHDRWWADILIGLAGIIAGSWAMAFPGLTAVGLMYFIAAWWLFTGLMEIVVAIRLREVISNEWTMILSGALSVVLGVLFLISPGDGAISLIWVIGIFAIVFGVMLVSLAFRLRGIRTNPRVMR